MADPILGGPVGYDSTTGLYVNLATSEYLTPQQAQQLATSFQQAQAMQPIQYDEAGTRLTPDGPGYGTPLQQAQAAYAQQQAQAATGMLNPAINSQIAAQQAQGWTPGYTSQDAQAYFTANPDVYAAFQANNYGMSPTQYAQTHFNNYGQAEGRQWGVPAASNQTYSMDSRPPSTLTGSGVTQPLFQGNSIPSQPVFQGNSIPGLQDIRSQVPTATQPFSTTTPISSGPMLSNSSPQLGYDPNQILKPQGPLPYAVDSSAWRAAPTALTDLQRGGTGMLFS